MSSEMPDVPVIKSERSDDDLVDEVRELREKVAELEDQKSAQERAIAAFQDSEEKFRTFCENSSDAVMRFDRQMRHLYVNAVVEQQTGISPEQFVGKTHTEMGFPKELIDIWEPAIAKVFSTKQEHRIEFQLPAGIWVDWLLIPEFSLTGEVNTVLTSARDITEKKRIELQLIHERYMLETFMDNIPDHVFFKDIEGRFTRTNQAQAKWLGAESPEALIGKTDFDFFSKEHAQNALDDEQKIIATGEPVLNKEEAEVRPNGKKTWVVTSKMPLRDVTGAVVGTFGISRNITGRIEIEHALIESKQMYSTVCQNTTDMIFLLSPDFHVRFANIAAQVYFKIDPDAPPPTEGALFSDLWCSESYSDIEQELNRALSNQKNIALECTCQNNQFEFRISPVIQNSQVEALLCVARDISERKGAEAALAQSERRYRRLTENASDIIWRTTVDGKILFVNSAVKLLGYTVEQATGLHGKDYLSEESFQKLNKLITSAIQSDSALDNFQGELEYLHRDGTSIPFEAKVSLVKNTQGRIIALEGISRDLRERKKAEQALRESAQQHHMLVESINDIIYITDAMGNFTYANPTAIQTIGFPVDELIGMHFTKVIREDYQDQMLQFYSRQFSDRIATTYCEFPTIAKNNKETWIGQNVQLMFEDGQVTGFQAVARDITQRRQIEEDLYNARDLLERRVQERTAELSRTNRLLLMEINERRRTQTELQDSLSKYRMAMEGIIKAMALTVEMRDPYTAGHQQRVTELAIAIAKEMGISKDMIDGIQMAGIIHDLGKISIPAEILSKPGRLTDIVFDMIKIHPTVGYDILKTIDFPWPVAMIIWQHHERIDGSGYPKGLMREDILVEARILMVADVFEAVSSHRPYRPALGTDAALEELSKNRGTKYDPEVVDACTRLIREKGFEFEPTNGDTTSARDS